ncbi:MAG: adenylate/guanylate cyclase domain-containing protein [Acidimicrobiia bacterium]
MSYTIEAAARRAGVEVESIARYAGVGLIDVEREGEFSDEDIRRIQVLQTLEQSGLPIDGVATLVNEGHLSLGFIEAAGQYVFVPLSDRTFAEASESTGIPLETLASIRESLGGVPPDPDDLLGEEELDILGLVEFQRSLGFRPGAIEQALHVYGESLRRMAETEAEWFRSEIVGPMLESGRTEQDVGQFTSEIAPRLAELSDEAVLAIYHRQQRHAWSVNIIDGIAMGLERAGLHQRAQTTPAMCFLDITGYTRLTQERGDRAAADFAERMKRLVERPAVAQGGRAVKWLGDGVMFYFATPKSAVEAAVTMVAAVAEARMAPAHVGIHAGPVVFREGDYYGHTVNVAARIGDFARPGEILVSQEVVDRLDSEFVTFTAIGPVELKGLGEGLSLYVAERRSPKV